MAESEVLFISVFREVITMISKKNAAIFLDRDGTIIEDVGHLKTPSDVVFFPGTFGALRALRKHFLLFIVTNQPGVAEGVISRENVNCVNAYLIKTLAESGIDIADIYVCPHSRSENCVCIKPKPYFAKKAAEDYDIDLQRSFVVGDHPHDIQLAKNVGARGIYVLTGHGHKHLPELQEGVEVVEGIIEAAEKSTFFYLSDVRARDSGRTETKFVLDLGVAGDLWQRPDLGNTPPTTGHIAQVLREAGVEVYGVSGGWLECEPRPAGIWEALTGKLAPVEWVKQFNCPPEKPGSVLQMLANKRVPVSDL
ncbi:MAG: HAD family hydrolase [Phycisphaerales bacterium]|jgi:D-glycero-D-manno-heptose 1,7-bisphosphate phosphatase